MFYVDSSCLSLLGTSCAVSIVAASLTRSVPHIELGIVAHGLGASWLSMLSRYHSALKLRRLLMLPAVRSRSSPFVQHGEFHYVRLEGF